MSVYIIDIDNTICETNGADYNNAKPFLSRIKYINELYDKGNIIIYYSGRGGTSGVDWVPTTIEQFKKWGVKYSQIICKKIYYDYWVDDKAVDINAFFGEAST